jgi:hypothetical protein
MTIVERSGDQTDAGLTQGISRVSIQADPNGLPFAVTLWHNSTAGTRIESAMLDLAERIEVGVLSATRVDAPTEKDVFIEVPSEFSGHLKLTKLLIDVQSRRLESGLVLASQSGRELVVVAGAYPYSLAIHGLGDANHRFEPEYPLDNYLRLAIT